MYGIQKKKYDVAGEWKIRLYFGFEFRLKRNPVSD